MNDKEIEERIEDVMNNMTQFELLKLRSTLINIAMLCMILEKKMEKFK